VLVDFGSWPTDLAPIQRATTLIEPATPTVSNRSGRSTFIGEVRDRLENAALRERCWEVPGGLGLRRVADFVADRSRRRGAAFVDGSLAHVGVHRQGDQALSVTLSAPAISTSSLLNVQQTRERDSPWQPSTANVVGCGERLVEREPRYTWPLRRHCGDLEAIPVDRSH
jgi:hypothetical protein